MVAVKQPSSIELASEIPQETMSFQMVRSRVFAKRSNRCPQPARLLIRMREVLRMNASVASATVSNCPSKAEDSLENLRAFVAMAEESIPEFAMMGPAARRQLADAPISALLPIDVTEKLRYDSSADQFHKTDRPTDLSPQLALRRSSRQEQID
jgi:hypothetical protein